MTKQRSARGTLTSKVKDAMFSTFGENVLPPIKNNSTPNEISTWKQSSQVIECYKNLFKPMNENSDQLVVSRIIEKVFPKKSRPPNIQVAYVIAICTTMLNPRYEKIMINKKSMKNKMKHYVVCMVIKHFYFSQVFVILQLYLLIFHFFKKKLEANEPIKPVDCISSDEDDDEDDDEDGSEYDDSSSSNNDEEK